MHLQKVKEILSRQKLVEEMIHAQSMARHDTVEMLVQRQHLAELKNLLEPLAAEEIANLLEALEPDAARVVWSQIPEKVANNVLWEVTDTCWVASTILTARRQLSWPVEAGNESDCLCC